MGAQIIEISGYVPAIMSMYMTGKNVDTARLNDIRYHVGMSTDRWGRVCNPTAEFNSYMDRVIKYGVMHEHETILDFIKISVFMEDLHRGAQDDYDAHSRRMDIIRSSTRANKKTSDKPEISEWYKDKIIPFFELKDVVDLPENMVFDCEDYILTPWGYIRADIARGTTPEDKKLLNDVLRGNVTLAVACDNISTMSFRNWRHVYHLRRADTHAAPELKEYVEEYRDYLYVWNEHLGEYLGKVWCPNDKLPDKGFYWERNKVKYVPVAIKED